VLRGERSGRGAGGWGGGGGGGVWGGAKGGGGTVQEPRALKENLSGWGGEGEYKNGMMGVDGGRGGEKMKC